MKYTLLVCTTLNFISVSAIPKNLSDIPINRLMTHITSIDHCIDGVKPGSFGTKKAPFNLQRLLDSRASCVDELSQRNLKLAPDAVLRRSISDFLVDHQCYTRV